MTGPLAAIRQTDQSLAARGFTGFHHHRPQLIGVVAVLHHIHDAGDPNAASVLGRIVDRDSMTG